MPGLPTNAAFATKYAAWKERLLDLTASNRLLNFRETKVSTIQITAPDTARLFDSLVVRERPLKFPFYRGRATPEGDGDEAVGEFLVTPGDVEARKSPPDLERSLQRLTALARTYREERGINTLYLAVGMLVWRPADGASPQRAPLLLVPVELKRENRLHPYVLHPFDEDPEVNPTLTYMLRRDFEYALPGLPDEVTCEAVDAFFHAVTEAVGGRGWSVEHTVWLGQFHFRKLAMYRDLEEHEPVAATNPRILMISGDPTPVSLEEGEADLDDISPADVFTALDSDESQTRVIIRARAGHDLVVQGPPGTGKSQTIANLIAQFLLDGKKVLFVSEKMAALSVVYERLRECGLGAFCLELHSDKANKRDTLMRIGRAVAAEPPSWPAADRQFHELLQLRRELNAYVRDLHRPALGRRSAFDLHGDLAKLDGAADVVEAFGFDATSLDESAEQEIDAVVARMARFGSFFDSTEPHCFAHLRTIRWSAQLQTELIAAMRTLATVARDVASTASRAAAFIHRPAPKDCGELVSLRDAIRVIADSPVPPRPWLEDAPLAALRDRATLLATKAATRDRFVNDLAAAHEPAVFQSEGAALVRDIVPMSVRKRGGGGEVQCLCCEQRNRVPVVQAEQQAKCGRCGALLVAVETQNAVAQLIADASTLIQTYTSLLSTIAEIETTAAHLASALGETRPESVQAVRRCVRLAFLVAGVNRAEPAWLDAESVGTLRSEAAACADQARLRTQLRSTLLAEHSEALFALPAAAHNTALRNEYHGRFRWFRSGYRRITRELRMTLHAPKRLRFNDYVVLTHATAELHRVEAWFAERRATHATSFGRLYHGIDTDWASIDRELGAMQALHAGFPDACARPAVSERLLTGTSEIREIADRLDNAVRRYAALLERPPLAIADGAPQPDQSFAAVAEYCHYTNTLLATAVEAVEAVHGTAVDGRRPVRELLVDALRLHVIQNIQDDFSSNAQRDGEAFGRLYSGIETRWAAAIEALDWAAKFRSIHGGNGAAVDAALAPLAIARARTEESALEAAIQRLGDCFSRTESLYVSEIVAELAQQPFENIATWAIERESRSGELAEWLQYAEALEDCRASGVDGFVEAARKQRVAAHELERVFRKALRVRQLDAIYRRSAPLRRFNVADHESLIARFRELDEKLMLVHRRRVAAAVASRRPNLTAAAAGQSRFLRKELAKQRRHVPLRRLFAEAGRVVLDLTPCLLMSPLSVATHLPKDSVEFDVAIFDEASQMPIEDAIAPLLRARQLIVAGDSKQMPPSRFFQKSADDVLDEDVAEQPLESILEDCEAAGMEAQPLRWHYRSRHESLIAFSNAEFYSNSLVTFPSPSVRPPQDLGVHFEYVADGVYDRGGSRTNRVEARRVAECVRRHLEQWPHRSLGVIAMSIAQAQAVEEEIEALLLARPDLEAKLRIPAGDPFFVKSLENVQGDERDSIILSIGYGKDGSGKPLALQFGPISGDGGERRLNVAVTRARCHITVVSSIRGTDINVAAVQRRGPKVLRRYLQYSEDGVLPEEMTFAAAEPDSPFEESVRAALKDAGYDVDCQVGVSRYRIDLAVRDPREPGRYLLGIECDGAAYHSSRVARDRDRLRQAVLEQRRWKIFRIWSTDWIRNRRATLERLLNYIASLTTSEEDDAGPAVMVRDDFAAAEEPYGELVSNESLIAIDRTSGDAEVATYSEVTLRRRHRDALYNGGTADTRELVCAVVDHEGPVHIDVVISRIARAHGLQRAGRIVEETIHAAINAAARTGMVVRRGDFLWPVGDVAIVPRRPAAGQPLRAIEHVAPEEIAEAAMLVVRSSGGVNPADLTRETARVLGYQRTGERVERAVRSAIDQLSASERLVLRAGFLVMP